MSGTIVDGKPVGRCPSDGGHNEYSKNAKGTKWHHWEGKDPKDKGEWNPKVRDDWEYEYDFEKDCLKVWHTSDGVRDKLEHDCTPPGNPFDLPPESVNVTRTEVSYIEYVPPSVEVPAITPLSFLLALLSLLGLAAVAMRRMYKR